MTCLCCCQKPLYTSQARVPRFRRIQMPEGTMEDTERFDPRRYKFWTEDHVRFSDLDPLGHVNNNAIGQYFENARAALFLKVMPDWPRQDNLFILAHIAIDFRRELHLP